MPWRVGSKKTSKGWPILKKRESGGWKTVGHSSSKEQARASIRARRAAEYGDKR
jgi:hypothetical protein